MIPRTFPSTYETANGQQRMVVFFLSDVTGLEAWSDYIPVKFAQLEAQEDNVQNNNGVHWVDPLASASGKQAWLDYVPVYADPNAADAWFVSAQGYIPVGYANKPSFSLDFTSASETLDPRITFSRGSLATRTNSDGLIEYAPHNLLTYSEQFDNAAWGKTNVTATANSIVAPDGTATADLLLDNSSSAAHYFSQTATYEKKTYTASVYMKQQSLGFYGFIRFGSGAIWSNNDGVIIDLSNGSLIAQNGIESYTIENNGNGWYRVSISDTPDNAGTGGPLQIGVTTGTGLSSVAYIGNGTSGIYLWGAQLNVGALQPYYPTTTAAYYGPRFDYNPVTLAPKGLLIEEQRTNLLTYSEQFDNAVWLKTNGTITANDVVAPDGTTTADKFTVTSSGSFARVYALANGSNSTTYTFSIYAKAGTTTTASIRARDTSTTAQTVTNITLTNEWQRFNVSVTTGASSTTTVEGHIFANADGVSGSATAGNTIYIWGAQLEAGAFPTSYIPTTTAQVTRSADVATVTGTNFSSWYNQDEGTLFGEASTYDVSLGRLSFAVTDGSAANRIHVGHGASPKGFIANGGVTQLTISIPSVVYVSNTFSKTILAYSNNNGNVAANGTIGVDDTSLSIPTVNQAQIGALTPTNSILNGHIRRIAYYPARLSNVQLQALTR